jgi:hypothetical protein
LYAAAVNVGLISAILNLLLLTALRPLPPNLGETLNLLVEILLIDLMLLLLLPAAAARPSPPLPNL